MTTPEKREKLKIYLKERGYDQSRLSEIFDISQPAISTLLSGKKAFGKKTAASWAEKLGLNASWLLTGEGEMLKENSSNQEQRLNTAREALKNAEMNAISTGKIIPYFDAEAAAGSSYGMSMEPARPVGMIEIGGLLKDSESALRVYGNSMTPNYPSGCVVGTKLHSDSFIEPGSVYLVETRENRYLKRLYYNKDKTAFRCVSDNHMTHESGPMKGELCYPEFEIPFNEVIRLHRVTGVIKRNII